MTNEVLDPSRFDNQSVPVAVNLHVSGSILGGCGVTTCASKALQAPGHELDLS